MPVPRYNKANKSTLDNNRMGDLICELSLIPINQKNLKNMHAAYLIQFLVKSV